MDIFSSLMLLPIACFAVLFLHLTGDKDGEEFARDWREAFLLAALAWGVFLVFASEILSPFHLLRRPVIAAVWAAALVVLVWRTAGLGQARAGLKRLVRGVRELDLWEKAILGALGLIAGLIFLIGWISPPNNVDAHLYHMARVMHWAQNGSLEHYAAKYHAQLNRPPFAGISILHLRTLWGNDQPASSVQWFSMVGSLVAVSLISARLGAGRLGQWAAAAFAATIPMGILQASSTQVDYVTAFWLVAALYFAIVGLKESFSLKLDLVFGAAAALCLLSKTTGYLYMFPVLVIYLIVRLNERGFRRAVLSALGITIVMIAANSGHWARNIDTYGSPLGKFRRYEMWLPDLEWLNSSTDTSEQARSSEHFDDHETSQGTVPVRLDAGGVHEVRVDQMSVTGGVSCCMSEPVRQAQDSTDWDRIVRWVNSKTQAVVSGFLIHTYTPSSLLNQVSEELLSNMSSFLHYKFFQQTEQIAWSHEDTATNPLHLGFVGFLIAAFIVEGVRGNLRQSVLVYTVMVFSGIVLLNSMGFSVWVLRYQLGFFVAAAPLFGWLLSLLDNRAIQVGGISLLLVGALPWVLLNNTRPLIGMEPWPTRIGSILTEPKERILFAGAKHQVSDARLVAEFVESTSCQSIGLRMDSSDLEYSVWWLLDAPQDGSILRILNPLKSLEDLPQAPIEPCIVICTICGNNDLVRGMPLEAEFGRYRIYASHPASVKP